MHDLNSKNINYFMVRAGNLDLRNIKKEMQCQDWSAICKAPLANAKSHKTNFKSITSLYTHQWYK